MAFKDEIVLLKIAVADYDTAGLPKERALKECCARARDQLQADAKARGWDCSDLLRDFNQFLAEYLWGQKTKLQFDQWLDGLLTKNLNGLSVSSSSPPSSDHWPDRQKTFLDLVTNRDVVLKHTIEHSKVLVFSGSVPTPKVIKDALQDKAGEFDKLSLTKQTNGYDFDVRLNDGCQYKEKLRDKESTVTITLPANKHTVLTPSYYERLAELEVLAKLALLRTLYADQSDEEFKKIPGSYTVDVKPTYDKGPLAVNDKLYCEALLAAYKKYGFGSGVAATIAAAPVVPATKTPPPKTPVTTQPEVFEVEVTAGGSPSTDQHTFELLVEEEIPGSPVSTAMTSSTRTDFSSTITSPLDNNNNPAHQFDLTVVSSNN